MRGRVLAGLGAVSLLALAGCDVRLRPVWSAASDGGAPVPDALLSPCPDTMIGYACLGPASGAYATTTGGGATAPVLVSAGDSDALAQFKAAADRKSGPAVIQIQGMISFAGFDSSQVRVASNTTIVGLDRQSGFTGGGLDLNGSSNVILKNLTIQRAVGTDAITVQGPDSTNIWIDHCDLSSQLHPDGASYDGLADITHAADWITVSWTRFHDHKDTGIIGHSDSNGAEDTGFLHVTYYYDWFQNVDAGPRVRFGTVHVLNTFFDHVAFYGVASTMSARVRVENSIFRSVTAAGGDPDYGPVTTVLPSSDPGFVDLVGNDEDATDGKDVAPSAQLVAWDPHADYKFTADSTVNARALVTLCAGPQAVPGSILPTCP